MNKAYLLLIILGLASCHSKQENVITPSEVKKNYAIHTYDSSTQDYFEYLGEINIQSDRYEVINMFRRVKAAIMWHGQSRLVFLSSEDTLSYMLNSNTDFPSSLVANKLYFPQKDTSITIDSLLPVICLPTGCVEKEKDLPGAIFINPDSVGQVFRGGYLPSN